jgi:hypothetical protein
MYLEGYSGALGAISPVPTTAQQTAAGNARHIVSAAINQNALYLPLLTAVSQDTAPMSDGLVAFWNQLTNKSSSWLKAYRLLYGRGAKTPYPSADAKSREEWKIGDVTFLAWIEPHMNVRALLIIGYNPLTLPAAVQAAALKWAAVTTADVGKTTVDTLTTVTKPITSTITNAVTSATSAAASATQSVLPMFNAAITAPSAFLPSGTPSAAAPSSSSPGVDFQPSKGVAWWVWALGGTSALVVGGLVIRSLKKK